MEGSSLLGFFQLKVMVLPVMDSITGVPSGGSGRISKKSSQWNKWSINDSDLPLPVNLSEIARFSLMNAIC